MAIYPIGMLPRPTFIVGALSIFFVLNIFSKFRIRKFFAVLLGFAFSIEAVFSFVYSTHMGVDQIAILFGTNLREAKEIISFTILPIILLMILSFVLVWKSIGELKNNEYSILKSLKWLGLFFLMLTPIIMNRVILNDEMHHYWKSEPFQTYQSVLRNYSPVLYSGSMSSYIYYKEAQKLRHFKDIPKSNIEGIELQSDSAKYKVDRVYFVVGESSLADRYSLYGYEVRKTTPFLDSLNLNDSTTILFKNSISSASNTTLSVPQMLSNSHARDMKRYHSEKSILDLANDANYGTQWISNQPRSALWEMVSNQVVLLSQNANRTFYSDAEDYSHSDDFELIDIYKQFQAKSAMDYQCTFFHLQGSHLLYHYRIDDIDSKTFPSVEGLKYQEEASLNYDRSVHHTDRFLRKIWDEIKADTLHTSVLVYTSDHGEIVGLGHGVKDPTLVQFHVPFVMLNNSDVDINSLVEKYYDTENGYINNASIFYIMLELLGYKVEDNLVEKSIIDGRYVNHALDVVKYENIIKD